MLLKIFSVLWVSLLIFAPLSAKDCKALTNAINNKKNLDVAAKINAVAIDFLNKPDQISLELLECALNFVVNQTNFPKQVGDREEVFEIIKYLSDHKDLIAKKDLSHVPKKQLEILQKNLTKYGELTNDLYVAYMKKIDKNTDLKNNMAVITKPESIFPGYERYLQDYTTKSPKTTTGILNFLMVNNNKLITIDKNDPTKEPRSAQKLYDTLRQLEPILVEQNKKSRLDFFGNRKRLQQIESINAIKSALVKIYGEFITYYTTFPPYFNEKFAITDEKNSVVFASVALALNTIIQEVNNRIYGLVKK